MIGPLLLRLVPLALALVWSLGWLPLPAGYMMLQVAGWQLETSLAILVLALTALWPLWYLLAALLRLPWRLALRLRTRREASQFLRLLGATLAGDWTRLEREAPRAADEPAVRALTAAARLQTGHYGEVLEDAEKLEKVAELRGGARLLRVRALRRHRGAAQALSLLDDSRFLARNASWFELRLQLLADLGRWDEAQKLLATFEDKKASLERSVAGREETRELERQLRLHLLAHTQTPNLLLERWQSIDDTEEAERALAAVVARLLELHQPGFAAELLAGQIAGPLEATAVSLCFSLPPGNHCRVPLAAVNRLRQEAGSSRRLRSAEAWLQLCAGEPAAAAETLADWGLDRN